MTLSEAITAVETNGKAYNDAVQTTTSDQSSVAAIQAKLDAANATVTSDKQSQSDAAKAYNDALKALIDTATAAMIPESGNVPISTTTAI